MEDTNEKKIKEPTETEGLLKFLLSVAVIALFIAVMVCVTTSHQSDRWEDKYKTVVRSYDSDISRAVQLRDSLWMNCLTGATQVGKTCTVDSGIKQK